MLGGHSVWQSSYVTAYCQGGTMASGGQTYVGEVATRSAIPFGTVIQLAQPAFGVRIFRVEDRMAPDDEAAIDVFYPSCSADIQWGVRAEKWRVVNGAHSRH